MLSLDNFVSYKKSSKRLGRGIGSGLGKTCGRGHKGQRARSSNIGGFEGGQLPIVRALPKRGFNVSRRYRTNHDTVNLSDLQTLLDLSHINVGDLINIDLLKRTGLVKQNARSVKLLAKGLCSHALSLQVHAASKGAIAAVESKGGTCLIVDNKNSLSREDA